MTMADDWFWACRCPMIRAGERSAAGDRFIIENGQDSLWSRFRRDIGDDRQCLWNNIHRMGRGAQIADILDMLFTVVPVYGVNHNRFVFEAAKIPVFARFLKGARSDLCNYVSNSVVPGAECYSDKDMRHLGRVVSQTLGCDEDWF